MATTGLREPHRLEHDVGQALVQAGQDEQVGGGQQPRDVVAMAEEPDPAVEPEGVRRLLELAAQRPVADDQGAKVGLDVLEQVERREQVVDPLLRGQPAGEEDQRGVAGPAEARRGPRPGRPAGGSSSSIPE